MDLRLVLDSFFDCDFLNSVMFLLVLASAFPNFLHIHICATSFFIRLFPYYTIFDIILKKESKKKERLKKKKKKKNCVWEMSIHSWLTNWKNFLDLPITLYTHCFFCCCSLHISTLEVMWVLYSHVH